MKMRIWYFILIVLSGILLSNCINKKATHSIIIATASNMQFVMGSLVKAFVETEKIDCEVVIGSSGKLSSQIMEGAPYDVFVSANMKYPAALFAAKKCTEPAQIYARGKLVLWTMKDKLPPLGALTHFKRIALANPQNAPYGKAAMEALTHMGLLDSLSSRLVYGESIAQTNQFITTKAVDAGFTAQSVVVSAQMRGKGKWLQVPDSLYAPIEQGVVLLKGKHWPESQKFVDFLFSLEAQAILRAYGYEI